MQEIRENLMQRLHEPVDLEQMSADMKQHLLGHRELSPPQPRPRMNRKQRRAKARERV